MTEHFYRDAILADAVSAFADQAGALKEGGVDFFLIETMPSIDMASAGEWSDSLFVDTVHLSDQGSEVFATRLASALRPLLDRAAAPGTPNRLSGVRGAP